MLPLRHAEIRQRLERVEETVISLLKSAEDTKIAAYAHRAALAIAEGLEALGDGSEEAARTKLYFAAGMLTACGEDTSWVLDLDPTNVPSEPKRLAVVT